MGAFDSLANLFNGLGEGISSIISNGTSLYAAYFIAFFGIFYWLVYIGINRGKFEGKPAKVISGMAAIIIIGSIFFKYKNITDLNGAIGGFGLFLLTTAAAIFIVFAGIKYYTNNREKHPAFASLMLFLSLYLFSSLIMPMFGNVAGTQSKMAVGEGIWFYEVVVTKFESIRVIGDILSWVQAISLIMIIWNTFRLVFGAARNGTGNIMRSEIGERLVSRLDESRQLKSLINNLETQLTQGSTIVNNLRRLL